MHLDLSDLANFAERLADTAGPIVMEYYRQSLEIDSKGDESPVTIADRKSETEMRELIENKYPEHGIYGEEFGSIREDAEWIWTLDPIDGTASFVTGKPLFGILVGLLHHGKPVVGVIDMPALGERFIGIEGQKSTYKGLPIRARSCASMDQAWLCSTSPHIFTEDNFTHFERLRKSARHTVYGSDCYAYGLLAAGNVDLVCEDTLKPHDYVALVPVITGAGGIITDWQGNPLTLESDGAVIASGDPDRHEEALRVLSQRNN